MYLKPFSILVSTKHSKLYILTGSSGIASYTQQLYIYSNICSLLFVAGWRTCYLSTCRLYIVVRWHSTSRICWCQVTVCSGLTSWWCSYDYTGTSLITMLLMSVGIMYKLGLSLLCFWNSLSSNASKFCLLWSSYQYSINWHYAPSICVLIVI